jgi:hypothetical protein
MAHASHPLAPRRDRSTAEDLIGVRSTVKDDGIATGRPMGRSTNPRASSRRKKFCLDG